MTAVFATETWSTYLYYNCICDVAYWKIIIRTCAGVTYADCLTFDYTACGNARLSVKLAWLATVA